LFEIDMSVGRCVHALARGATASAKRQAEETARRRTMMNSCRQYLDESGFCPAVLFPLLQELLLPSYSLTGRFPPDQSVVFNSQNNWAEGGTYEGFMA
jgi:hypothetical protein